MQRQKLFRLDRKGRVQLPKDARESLEFETDRLLLGVMNLSDKTLTLQARVRDGGGKRK
jgi:DNA-binding transcriptional regulator/RsmH inhibitor MraZ